MIAHLRGNVLEKEPGHLIVDVSGVGYDVTVPISTWTRIPDLGHTVSLLIYTVVREDALLLFGFLTKDEKALFEKLISVSGIGPKLAVTVLSGLAAPDLIAAIRGGDLARLTRIPGVGKKTAERLVVELRDKVGAPTDTPFPVATAITALDQDVLSALVNLGCQRNAAEAALAKLKASGAPQDFETLFRRALELVR
ncbi:MAG: Holliday junction branch migration protein RuvA [Acidobacteria bacterium]|nr:Holliday junction branch migration protein RuvA [Acidobacteriota bacterium]